MEIYINKDYFEKLMQNNSLLSRNNNLPRDNANGAQY